MSGRDIPIIFSGPMVRALLEGRKTMTRRLAWKPNGKPSPWQNVKPGDRLWVRETWCDANCDAGPVICYRANTDRWQPAYTGKDYGAGPSFDYERYPGNYTIWAADLENSDKGWRSPIHMPRWASRLTLIVTKTKIEPLQVISGRDAKAEGTQLSEIVRGLQVWHSSHQAAFAALWNSLHGPEAWSENPEVVALTFEVHKQNIASVPLSVAGEQP